ITTHWKLETDLEKTSEVEVRFVSEAPNRTRVELEHRNLDRHGEGWEEMRDAVGSPGGWAGGLRLFADAARAAQGGDMPVQPIPEGAQTLTPYLVLDDAAGAIDFYRRAFGAEERLRMDGPDGKVAHASMR